MNFNIIFGFLILSTFIYQTLGIIDYEVNEQYYPNLFITKTVSYSDLANGGDFIFYAATSSIAQYRIFSVVSQGNESINFLGGDRSLYIGTINETKWILDANSLAVCGQQSFTTNSQGLGFTPSFDTIATIGTIPGEDIIVKYIGGSTDYTIGQIIINIFLFQITK